MIDIKGLGHGIPIHPDDMERERLKDIKSRLGKVAFTSIAGSKPRSPQVHNGIVKAEGALKWIDEVFQKEEWKNS